MYRLKQEITYAEVIIEDTIKAGNCFRQLSFSSAILQERKTSITISSTIRHNSDNPR
jgi:hypothetical protein